MSILLTAVGIQLSVLAAILIFGSALMLRRALSFSLNNTGLADRAAAREQELHDREHDITVS